jgi:hypothetical protein
VVNVAFWEKETMPKPPTRSQANDAEPSRPAPRERRRTPRGRVHPDRSDDIVAMTPGAPAPLAGIGPETVHDEHDDDRPASAIEAVSMSSEPSEEDIRLRAYQRYLERGRHHGADFDDWLEAEAELRKR